VRFAHAAAFALVGWYLMVPGEDVKNPIAQLRVYRSYDTASECQAAMDAHRSVLNEHEQDHSRFKKLTPEERVKEATKEAEWEYEFGFAQCVATDDPRLKVN
jgi:hypothetical protein